MNSRVYEYRPLSANDSVRLLRISRDEELPHGIALSLTEAHLDDEPEYTALSYTWDLPHYVDIQGRIGEGPGATFEVICDNKTMTISKNLFDFVCAVLKTRGGSPAVKTHETHLTPKVDSILATLPIWIDAFCINQTDTEEKRHQVLLMHRIYSAAQNVVIWLGTDEPSPDVLWVHDKFIPAIPKVAKSKPGFVKSQLSVDPTCVLPSTAEELGPELCYRWTSAWLTFSMFIDRQRWFDRGWIVQEVALADPANVYVLCGRAALGWKRLAAFSLFLHETGWSAALSRQLSDRLIVCNQNLRQDYENRVPGSADSGLKMYKVSQARRSLAEVAQRTGLLDKDFGSSNQEKKKAESAWWSCANMLIHSLRSSQFSDPRDHIYGCLGMLSMLLPQGIDSPIIPDYVRSVEEVFTTTAIEFVREVPLFWELSQVGLRPSRRYPNLPSWVPDYSVQLDRPTGLDRRFALNRYLGHSPGELKRVESEIWGALGDQKLNADFPCVRGTLVDTVSLVSADKPYQWKSMNIRNSIAKLKFVNRVSLGATLLAVKTFWHALKLMTLLNTEKDHTPPSFHPIQRQYAKLCNTTIAEEDWKTSDSDIRSRLNQLGKDVRSELARRCLYMTTDDTIGLGPLTTQPADQVWLIRGAWSPFVLRKVGPQTYEFIGETDYLGLDLQDINTQSRNAFYEQIYLV